MEPKQISVKIEPILLLSGWGYASVGAGVCVFSCVYVCACVFSCVCA